MNKVRTRREILRSSVAIGALATVAASACPALAFAVGKQPNIVFILADDLGYADVSCYGRREYKTPAIDRIATEGLRFTQAYANSAVCSATRTALMTGRYQNRLPIGLEEPLGKRPVGLPPSHPTLPSLLRKVGYQTALIGKWHLGELPKYGPLQSGYDHFWGFRGGALDYFSHESMNGGLWDDDRQIAEPGYLTELMGNHAVDVLNGFAKSDRPFFLSLHFNAPHWPWEGPDDEVESKRLATKGGPMAIVDFDGGSMAVFAKMVTAMDAQIARVLATLDQLHLSNDTIVIFTSDNGGERYSDTWPFTGKKTELLEGGLRIPAVVRWPGHIKAKSVSQQVMITMDWLPTLLAAAGGSPDPQYPSDGVDLTPMLSGGRTVERTLCWRYLNLTQEACRSGDWKYLRISDHTFLFNVVEDPLERANLKERKPERYKELIAKYQAWSAQMLPLDMNANTAGFSGENLADHFGVEKVENPGRPPMH